MFRFSFKKGVHELSWQPSCRKMLIHYICQLLLNQYPIIVLFVTEDNSVTH